MLTQTSVPSRIVMVRMDPHEDVLESLQAAVAEAEISDAAILSGAGSLSAYNVHVVETTNLPPGDVFFEGAGAYDILTLTGIVMNGRVHAHITFSNTEKALGGHLEPGCKVLTFAVCCMAEISNADVTDWDRLRAPG